MFVKCVPGSFIILSGVFSATSSISTPPSGLATITGLKIGIGKVTSGNNTHYFTRRLLTYPLCSLSIKMQKYVSRTISMASATITLDKSKETESLLLIEVKSAFQKEYLWTQVSLQLVFVW